MTLQEQTKQKIEVMQAYLAGKEIEYRLKNGSTFWIDISNPVWAWDASDYRIKPEAKITHDFKVGDIVILKNNCNGITVSLCHIYKVDRVNGDSLWLDISSSCFSVDDYVKVDDALWYWEYQHKNGLWCITSCRFTKEGIIKHLSEYGATNLTPLYALGARLPEDNQ